MSAKSKDTTKTAHVMNLLRKNTAAAPTPAPEPAEKHEPETKPKETVEAAPVRPAPAQHPIIASLNEEAAVSQEIKDALEQELMEEGGLPVEEPAAQEEPAPEEPSSEPEAEFEELDVPAAPEAAAEEPAPVEEVPVTPEPAPVEEPPEPEVEFEELDVPAAPEAAAEEPAPVEEVPVTPEPAPVEEPPAPEPQSPPVEICNVMQLMVEENVDKYLKRMKLCDCPRCKADVQALALSNLQPKYVVMGPGESIPRITMYRWQYQVEVTAQILRACEVVAEHPRHDLPS